MKTTMMTLAALLSLSAGVAFADPPQDLRGPLGPDRAPLLKERIERRMAHARQRIDALAAEGRIGQNVVARFRTLEARARQTVDRVFADDQVTLAERQELRALRHEARQFRREVRGQLGLGNRDGRGGRGGRGRGPRGPLGA